jgi:hypothetical protein
VPSGEVRTSCPSYRSGDKFEKFPNGKIAIAIETVDVFDFLWGKRRGESMLLFVGLLSVAWGLEIDLMKLRGTLGENFFFLKKREKSRKQRNYRLKRPVNEIAIFSGSGGRTAM